MNRYDITFSILKRAFKVPIYANSGPEAVKEFKELIIIHKIEKENEPDKEPQTPFEQMQFENIKDVFKNAGIKL